MTMKLRVEHTTHYQYDTPVRYALQQLKLTPKERPGQQLIHNWTIEIDGGSQQLHYTDHHGNGVDLIAVDSGASELVIRCAGEVELVTWDGVIGPHRGPMPLWGFLRRTPQHSRTQGACCWGPKCNRESQPDAAVAAAAGANATGAQWRVVAGLLSRASLVLPSCFSMSLVNQ